MFALVVMLDGNRITISRDGFQTRSSWTHVRGFHLNNGSVFFYDELIYTPRGSWLIHRFNPNSAWGSLEVFVEVGADDALKIQLSGNCPPSPELLDGPAGGTSEAEFEAVILWGKKEGPTVFGQRKEPLGPACYRAVGALIRGCVEASPRGKTGVSLALLKQLYGTGHPNRLLAQVRTIDDDWRDAIRMGRGKVGYWINDEDERHARG